MLRGRLPTIRFIGLEFTSSLFVCSLLCVIRLHSSNEQS